jgi:16S rRNA (uracil1498-N3)-methyltransferase
MLLFYDTEITTAIQEFTFDRAESKHLTKVLRKEVGTEITLTDGKGLQWTGKLSLVSPQKVCAEKIEAKQHLPPKKRIHLAIAPTKSNERMEWIVEKLTELGISSITPLLCYHSERKVVKTARWKKIAIAALKQSQQFFLPEILPLTSFQEQLEALQYPALIAHCKATPKKLLSEYSLASDQISLWIGPEGDFSVEEIKAATKAGLTPVSLGTQRFRTETAGILGCHSLFMKQQNP